ncbi:Ig-like domain-containing protein [Ferrimonas balearica]|uniref:Ig-like domain-containing protein n=1 Tax=Ferrimonas balearica TaxID=44012 RepID=UPI001C99C99B|nr:cadherin-like domain-containing protein [Ferrimonas balearica]MBY5992443.1 cadherin-like domain-containing protein [Ferrimonas balearica]
MKAFQKTALALLMGSVALVGCSSDNDNPPVDPPEPPPENTPPVAADGTRMTESNLPITINPMLHASDEDEGDILTLAAATVDNGDLTIQGDRILFDPKGYVGEAAIAYTVSDGTDEATGTITVAVGEAIFAGSQSCLGCHSNPSLGDMRSHQLHGHNFKIMQIADDQVPEFPYSDVSGALEQIDNNGESTDNTLGTPQTYADVSYTSGGYGWKLRWMDKDGYLVTGSQAQHNIHAEALGLDDQIMSNYNAGSVDKPWDCGHCHTTGWKPYDEALNPQKQDDLPGIYGTFVAEGVQCESCHGAGIEHTKAPSKDNITRFATPRLTADLQSEAMGYGQPVHCAECHTRDGDRNHKNGYESSFNKAFPEGPEYGARVMVRSGLPRHHQTHDELMAIDPVSGEITGKHYEKFPIYYGAENACAVCHDTHKSTLNQDEAIHQGAVKACTDCHSGDHAVEFNSTLHANFECTTCHMPEVVKNATSGYVTGEGRPTAELRGDIRIHTFAIDLYNEQGQLVDADAKDTHMFPYLQQRFACGQCHAEADDYAQKLMQNHDGKMHK